MYNYSGDEKINCKNKKPSESTKLLDGQFDYLVFNVIFATISTLAVCGNMSTG